MTKISKSQRDQLIAVAVAAAAVIACLWYLVVLAQNKQLAFADANCVKMRNTLKLASDKVRQADAVSAELAKNLDALRQREAGLAPEREPFSWLAETMRAFWSRATTSTTTRPFPSPTSNRRKSPTRASSPASPTSGPNSTSPARATTMISERFIADFENAFPYFRIVDLDIAVPGLRRDADMLSYTFDIVTPQVPAAAETK